MPSEAAVHSDWVDALYREAGPFALSKTTYLVGRRDIAEEIVQEVFLKLWQKQLRFSDARHAYAWIYAACHNAGIDHLRSRRRATLSSQRLTSIDLKPPESAADRTANQQILAQLMARFSEREARIVAYRFIDSLPLKSIAEMMGLSEKTVQRALLDIQKRHADLGRLCHGTEA